MKTESCSDCYFWVMENGNDSPENGDCHRNPPTNPTTGSAGHGFPVTMGHDWCGEYRAGNKK